ncbi:MAG: hypothetical protein HQL32_13620 [Planctomycetes bacterium]|nr:hypothetical protein [Planctomycetota bacterium]
MKTLTFLFVCLCGSHLLFANVGKLIPSESGSTLRSGTKMTEKISAPVAVNYGDVVQVGSGDASLEFNDGAKLLLGQDSLFVIDQDLTGWNTIDLLKGSLDIAPTDKKVMIKTPSSEVVLFSGQTKVYTQGAGTVVIPQTGPGAMIYSADGVKTICCEQYATIDQHGRLYIFVKDANIASGPKTLGVGEREKLFQSLKLDREVEVPAFMPDEVRDLLFARLNFSGSIVALESSSEIFDYYHEESELVEEGRELIFAQDLFSAKDNSVLMPESVLNHFADNENAKRFLKMTDRANKSLDELSAREKNFVIFFFRQKIVESLTPKYQVKDGFSASFKELIVFNSNVTQLADGQVAISETDGVSASSSLKLKYDARDYFWGKPSFQLRVSDVGYFKKVFQDREYTSFKFKIRNKLKLSKDKYVSSITPSLSVREDYLNAENSKYHGFTTYNGAVEVLLRPWKNLGHLSDVALLFISAGVEMRAYGGPDARQVDNFDNSKDSTSPKASLIFLNMKKWKKYQSKSTLIMSYKKPSSDAPDYQYTNLRFDLSYDMIFPVWTIIPSYAYGIRDQDEYNKSPREDDIHEFGLAFRRRIFKDKGGVGLGLRHIVQSSSRETFEYDNDQVSFNFSYSF